MLGETVLYNGRLVAREAAAFALDDTDISYGYGCYETLKVRSGLLYFAPLHAERLLASAAILGIAHDLDPGKILQGLEQLLEAAGRPDSNLKLLLVGREGRAADWYAFLLPALRPPETAASEGVECLIYRGERQFPRAKSLSMLLSTIAFRAASGRACWDALLVNRREEITEGTRTNIFFFDANRPQTLFTPPSADCLAGITKATLTEALAEKGIPVREEALPLELAKRGEHCIFVTSTSSLLLPVRRIIDGGGYSLPIPPRVGELETIYAAFLRSYEERARAKRA